MNNNSFTLTLFFVICLTAFRQLWDIILETKWKLSSSFKNQPFHCWSARAEALIGVNSIYIVFFQQKLRSKFEPSAAVTLSSISTDSCCISLVLHMQRPPLPWDQSVYPCLNSIIVKKWRGSTYILHTSTAVLSLLRECIIWAGHVARCRGSHGSYDTSLVASWPLSC